MGRSQIIKALTLLSFCFFLTIFLLYRTGKLDRYLSNETTGLQTSHNGGSMMFNGDTSGKVTDTAEKIIVSSSKNTLDVPAAVSASDSAKKMTSIELLSSSKSTIIFKPQVSLKFSAEKPKTDSSQNLKGE